MNILKAKWSFKKPKKNKFLIFDRNSVKAFNFYLGNKKFEVLDRRGESINFFVLIYTIFFDSFKYFKKNFLKNLKNNYFKNYISIVDPKIVLSGIDNDFTFFILKKIYPKPKYICVQRSMRNFQHFENLKKFSYENEMQIDYYFIFNSSYKKVVSKFVKAKFIEIGSIYNNSYFKKKKNKLLKGITFISQKKDSRPFNVEEKEVLNLLIKYCESKKIQLNFLSKLNRNYRNQLSFLNKYKNIKIFFNSKNIKKNYEIINRSKMVVFIYSTLGYESFAKGIKTISVSYISNKNNSFKFKPIKFGYPGNLKSTGFFWISNNNENLFFKTLSNVYNCKSVKWLKIYKNYKKRIMEYDPGNAKFKSIISGIINE
jgi:surface carbohydrate biosynthesis protein